MDYVELSRSRSNIIGDFGLVKGFSVAKTSVNFYSGRFIDISNISIFNPSKELFYYKAIPKANDFISNSDIFNRTMGLVQIQYTQSSVQEVDTFVVITFDIVLAEIGGFLGFVMLMLQLAIGSY